MGLDGREWYYLDCPGIRHQSQLSNLLEKRYSCVRDETSYILLKRCKNHRHVQLQPRPQQQVYALPKLPTDTAQQQREDRARTRVRDAGDGSEDVRAGMTPRRLIVSVLVMPSCGMRIATSVISVSLFVLVLVHHLPHHDRRIVLRI